MIFGRKIDSILLTWLQNAPLCPFPAVSIGSENFCNEIYQSRKKNAVISLPQCLLKSSHSIESRTGDSQILHPPGETVSFRWHGANCAADKTQFHITKMQSEHLVLHVDSKAAGTGKLACDRTSICQPLQKAFSQNFSVANNYISFLWLSAIKESCLPFCKLNLCKW